MVLVVLFLQTRASKAEYKKTSGPVKNNARRLHLRDKTIYCNFKQKPEPERERKRLSYGYACNSSQHLRRTRLDSKVRYLSLRRFLPLEQPHFSP